MFISLKNRVRSIFYKKIPIPITEYDFLFYDELFYDSDFEEDLKND